MLKLFFYETKQNDLNQKIRKNQENSFLIKSELDILKCPKFKFSKKFFQKVVNPRVKNLCFLLKYFYA